MMKQVWPLGLVLVLNCGGAVLAQSEAQSNLSLISGTQAGQLGLTAAQKQSIIELQQQTHGNLTSILTPGQLQQFQASLAQGQTTRDALQSADLNLRQKVRVKNLMEGTLEKLQTILTPAQFNQIKSSVM